MDKYTTDKHDLRSLITERHRWQDFSVHPRLLARHDGGAPNGHRVSFHLHDDAALLGCVTRRGAIGVGVDRVVAFVGQKLAVWKGPHAQNQLTSGALEQLKAKLQVELFSMVREGASHSPTTLLLPT